MRSPNFDVQPHPSIAVGNQPAHGWQAVELNGIPAGSGCCFLQWQLTLAWMHSQQTVTIMADGLSDREEVSLKGQDWVGPDRHILTMSIASKSHFNKEDLCIETTHGQSEGSRRL